jgi:hypothetical protein
MQEEVVADPILGWLAMFGLCLCRVFAGECGGIWETSS